MRKLLVLSAVVLALFGTTSTAYAHTGKTAKERYYHANGIVKWIGAHAKFTQYHPDPKKKRHWQKAVHFWIKVRREAWAEMHPAPSVSTSSWQATVKCENGGNWNDSPGYFYLGLQFDPGTWANAASHTGHWGTSPEDQVINATWTAKNSSADPWPNCPDPYWG